MPKPELGQKHECDDCGARFYDLGRPEASCPKCGTVSLLAVGAIPEKRRRRRGEQIAAEKVVAKPAKPETTDDEDDEEDEIEELDLDESQAERHLKDTAGTDDDDGDDADADADADADSGDGIESELSEVEDIDDDIPEIVGAETGADDDEAAKAAEVDDEGDA